MIADPVFGPGAAGPAAPGGFNLLPYRERLAQALRRRRAAQCGAAIVLGVLGAVLWTGAAAAWRSRVDAERASVDARLRQWQPQVDAAKRAAGAAAGLERREAQAAVLAAPYRRVAGLLATLAQIRDDAVRLDALRATSSGAVLDARAASYRAAARWLARIATDARNGRIDIGELTSASAAPATAAGMPFRFSVQVRWQDGESRRNAAGGGA
ncbi:fimbrial protein [Burkholderia anthina]|uniref:fimbrial protein n=1 Tax=Burkholderia anthina TaxID=179879 RepID=UPI00158EA0A9|nr:fimbrial protein [Burkholderia anthina]